MNYYKNIKKKLKSIKLIKFFYCFFTAFFHFMKYFMKYFPLFIAVWISFIKVKKSVICYCQSPLHFQNIQNLPEMLQKKGFKVFITCKFSTKEHQIVLNNEEIKIYYEIDHFVFPILCSSMYLSAFVCQNDYFPLFSKTVLFLPSFAGISGIYSMDAFDGYKYIYCAHEHQINEFKILGFKNKVLIRGGYPRLDCQIRQLKKDDDIQPDSIIYAPTHTSENINTALTSLKFAPKIIGALLKNGYKVIFRPHPTSFSIGKDTQIINEVYEKYNKNENFCLDKAKNYHSTYNKSLILITDLSGTGFTFSFIFDRPTVFFVHNHEAEFGMAGIHFENRENIGEVVRNEKELIEKIKYMLKNNEKYAQKIIDFRKKTVYNILCSEKYFMKNLTYIIENKKNKDWEYL